LAYATGGLDLFPSSTNFRGLVEKLIVALTTKSGNGFVQSCLASPVSTLNVAIHALRVTMEKLSLYEAPVESIKHGPWMTAIVVKNRAIPYASQSLSAE
jgi:hypothetical protein